MNDFDKECRKVYLEENRKERNGTITAIAAVVVSFTVGLIIGGELGAFAMIAVLFTVIFAATRN